MRTLGAISDCESSDSDSETAYKLSDDKADRDDREATQGDTWVNPGRCHGVCMHVFTPKRLLGTNYYTQ